MNGAPELRLSGIVRLFVLCGALAALPALIVAGYAAYQHVESLRATELAHVEDETRTRAAGLGEFARIATGHVARMRLMFEAGLAAPQPSPLLAKLRGFAAGELAGAAEGVYFGREPGAAPPLTVIAAADLLDGAQPALAELNAFLNLTPTLVAAHSLDNHLRWSFIIPASRSYFAVYPWGAEADLLKLANANSTGALLDGYHKYSVFANGRPEVNAARQPYWTEVYEDAGGTGLMVSYATPVYDGQNFVGVVGADVLLSFLADFLAPSGETRGGSAIVDSFGEVLAATGTLARSGRSKLAEIDATAAGMPSDGVIRLANGAYRVSVQPADAPWRLVRVIDAADIDAAVRPNLTLAIAVTAGILASIGLGLLIFIRGFGGPVLSLIGRVSAHLRGETALPAPASGAWNPWFRAIDKAFAAQHESEAMRNAILGVALDAIVVIDEEGRIVMLADGVDTRFGHDSDAVVGRPIHEVLVPPEARNAHLAGITRYKKTGEKRVLGQRIEVDALNAAGERVPVELMIGEVEVNGQRLFVAFLRDISSRRAANAEIARQREALHQSEKLTALGSLLAGVAHELNNPLSVVVGRAIMLEETVSDPKVRDPLRRLREAAERCARISKTFLAIARRAPASRAAVPLAKPVTAAVELNAYAVRASGIETVIDIPESLPPVMIDEDQIVQVVANLIVNAEHALRGQPEPRRIEFRAYQADNGMVALRVSDNGPGIPPDVSARVFEPFFTTKEVGVGTGIGLSVSLGMIEAMGGRMELDPGWGRGACFTIFLPVAGAATEEDAGLIVQTGGAAAQVLVVDDEPEVGALLADILTNAGHSVDLAANGQEALRLIDSGRAYNAVLTDARMPGLDGRTLARMIVERRPGLKGRIVIVTGDNMAGSGEAGEWPVIEKPFNPSQIRSTLAEILNN